MSYEKMKATLEITAIKWKIIYGHEYLKDPNAFKDKRPVYESRAYTDGSLFRIFSFLYSVLIYLMASKLLGRGVRISAVGRKSLLNATIGSPIVEVI